MPNKLSRFILAAVLLLYFSSLTQAQKISKLELKPGEVFFVGADNILVVDTLILHDNSTIQFAPHSKGMLGVRIAYVGENCLTSAKGLDGEHGSFDTNGADGGNLEIDIHFMTLGSLAIDTRGGNGGDGHIGKSGDKPTSSTFTRTVSDGNGGLRTVSTVVELGAHGRGEFGTPPGTGGNGGSIILTYSTDKFIPNFNHNPRKKKEKEEHLIEIAYEAGNSGENGRDGNSYTGRSNRPTLVKGGIITKRHAPRKDGNIKLINANKPLH